MYLIRLSPIRFLFPCSDIRRANQRVSEFVPYEPSDLKILRSLYGSFLFCSEFNRGYRLKVTESVMALATRRICRITHHLGVEGFAIGALPFILLWRRD
jgi:hypothetical protein